MEKNLPKQHEVSDFFFFETPRELIRYFKRSTDTFQVEKIREIMRRSFLKRGLSQDTHKGQTCFYLNDLSLLKKGFPNAENGAHDTALLSTIVSAWERFRTEVQRVLEEDYELEVKSLKQKAHLSATQERKEISWSFLKRNEASVAKVSQGHHQLPEDLSHPNLAEERVLVNKEGQQISIAPDCSDAPTLFDLVKKGEISLDDTLAFMADGMAGCAYLHTRGYAHGDGKAENILILKENEISQGVLFDLEHTSPFGAKATEAFTPIYSEFFYFGPDGKNIFRDAQSDTFAFGISLLRIVLLDEKVEKLYEKCLSGKNKRERQNILFSFIDSKWPKGLPEELKALMKSMLYAERDERISMEAAVASLRFIGQMDELKAYNKPLFGIPPNQATTVPASSGVRLKTGNVSSEHANSLLRTE